MPVSDKIVPEWGLIQPYRRTIAPTPPHCQKPDANPDFSVFTMQCYMSLMKKMPKCITCALLRCIVKEY